MASINKVLLLGNLTRDPEVRQFQGGQSVCKFGLATNRRFKSQSGEMKEETTFVDITVWGNRGEALAKYLHKGDPVFIEGRLVLEEWQDKTTGQKRTKLSVTAEDWQFVSGRGDGARGGAPRAQEPADSSGSSASSASADDEASLDAGGNVPF